MLLKCGSTLALSSSSSLSPNFCFCRRRRPPLVLPFCCYCWHCFKPLQSVSAKIELEIDDTTTRLWWGTHHVRGLLDGLARQFWLCLGAHSSELQFQAHGHGRGALGISQRHRHYTSDRRFVSLVSLWAAANLRPFSTCTRFAAIREIDKDDGFAHKRRLAREWPAGENQATN